MFDKRNPVLYINGVPYEFDGLPKHDFDIPDQDIKKSVLNGKITKVIKGLYYEGSVILYQYTEELHKTLKMAGICTYCPYGDYSIDGRYKSPRFEAILTEVKTFHIEDKLFADALMIKIRSVSYYTLEKYDTAG